jgi:uncharacterized membrane protein YgaE (UPF0421/DUF939 family)
MATVGHHPWYDLTTHRSWEDIVSMILGAIVLVVPAVMAGAENTTMVITSGIAGLLVICLAALAMARPQRWQDWAAMLCGLWLIASPYVLGFAGSLRTLHVVVGIGVCVLALLELWQDSSGEIRT